MTRRAGAKHSRSTRTSKRVAGGQFTLPGFKALTPAPTAVDSSLAPEHSLTTWTVGRSNQSPAVREIRKPSRSYWVPPCLPPPRPLSGSPRNRRDSTKMAMPPEVSTSHPAIHHPDARDTCMDSGSSARSRRETGNTIFHSCEPALVSGRRTFIRFCHHPTGPRCIHLQHPGNPNLGQSWSCWMSSTSLGRCRLSSRR